MRTAILSGAGHTLWWMEIDVYARERVFEMVAQRGRYLAPDDLLTLDPEEGELLERFVEHEWPDLAVAQGPELEWVAGLICGLINIAFDREAAQRIREIPEDERPAVREQTVNAESWHQLRNRAAHQVLYAAPGRGRAGRYVLGTRFGAFGGAASAAVHVAPAPRADQATTTLTHI
jgi:hypothetical protein